MSASDACRITAGTSFDLGRPAEMLAFDGSGAIAVNYSLATPPSLYVSLIDPVTRIPAQVTGSPFATTGGMRRGQIVVR
jgi:hypothetical protein